jgi:hypothetical protein
MSCCWWSHLAKPGSSRARWWNGRALRRIWLTCSPARCPAAVRAGWAPGRGPPVHPPSDECERTSSLCSEAEYLAHELADRVAMPTRGSIAATQDRRACRRLELRTRAGEGVQRTMLGPAQRVHHILELDVPRDAGLRERGWIAQGRLLDDFHGVIHEFAVHGSPAPEGAVPLTSEPGSAGLDPARKEAASNRSATPGRVVGSTSRLRSGTWRKGPKAGVGAAWLRTRLLAAGSDFWRAWGATNTSAGAGSGEVVAGEACRVKAMAPPTAAPWRLTDSRNRWALGRA